MSDITINLEMTRKATKSDNCAYQKKQQIKYHFLTHKMTQIALKQGNTEIIVHCI